MQKPRFNKLMRGTALTVGAVMAGLVIVTPHSYAEQLRERNEANKPRRISELKPRLTQTLTPEQWRKVDAKRQSEARAKEANLPAVRLLTGKEMASLHGRGAYRNRAFNGTLPWQRSMRDVNLCNGNLFKSFTDVQVAPARGAGLTLQRTYNSNDDRPGPFGIGWTHAYDIRMEEAGNNQVPRTDFFGGKHTYHRDADGLYSPPAYLFDQTESAYDTFLVNGPPKSLEDTETGMDGTMKHYVADGTERVCDYIADRYGNKTTLAYNLTVTLGDGTQKKLLTTVTDPSGRVLTFSWNNQGTTAQPAWRITSVAGPQYSVAYGYNADANLSSVTLDPTTINPSGLNRKTTFGYTTYSDAGGSETGLLASITDPLGHTVSYTFSNGPQWPTSTLWISTVTEPAGVDTNNAPRTQSWAIYSPGTSPYYASGAWTNPPVTWLYDTSDPTGTEVGVGFDNQFRKTTYCRYGRWQTYNTSYDSANNVTAQDQDSFRTDNYTNYGPHGNLLAHTVNGFSGTDATDWYNGSQYFQRQDALDMAGHASAMGVGAKSAGTPGDADTNPGDRGSVLWMRDAGNSIVGSPSYQKQFTYTYNQYGQKLTETNLNGVTTTYTYGDQWGNLTCVVQDPPPQTPDGKTHLNRTTTMTYDSAGHVLTNKDPNGNTAKFYYNALGQPKEADFVATTALAESVVYAYDANGRINSVTNNRGTMTLTYENASDRIHSVTDPVTGTVFYTYNRQGQRLTMTLPGSSQPWTYTYGMPGIGYLIEQVLPKDDPNSLGYRMLSVRDDAGRIVEFYNPNSFQVYRRPDTVRSNETFDASLNLATYQQTNYTYDTSGASSHNWLTQITTTFWTKNAQGQWQSKLINSNTYTYDAIGQRKTNAVSSLDGSGNPVSRTEQYGYDVVNRLTTVDYGDGQSQSYGFDSMGNRLSKSDSTTGTENYTFDATNRLTGRTVAGTSSVYTSDADGNTLSGGGRTMTWDSQNRMATCLKAAANGNPAVTSSFVYGADGIRRQETTNAGGTTNTTDFVTDASLFVREVNHQTGATLATYLVGLRGPEYKRDDVHLDANGKGTVRWYVFDGLGSVVGEVDLLGNVSGSRKHDVYGLTRQVTGTITSKHGYVGSLGHASEDETGLIYMRARYYDPATGRFCSADCNGDGPNCYIYCSDNPANLVDATGNDGGDNSSGVPWQLQVNWFYAGMLFTTVAIGVTFAIFRVCFSGNSSAAGNPVSKGLEVGLLFAVTAATFCFAQAATGMSYNWQTGKNIAAGVAELASGLTLMYKSAAAAMATEAATAVICLLIEATIVSGYLASIGADIPN